MENLPQIKKQETVAVSIYNPAPGTKAVDVRRKMLAVPEIAKSLTDVEKYVFVASTKKIISEIDDETLVSKTRQMFRFIALDVGYNIPNIPEDWAYIQTRLLDILKRYYGNLTLSEIKLAFELAMTGALDDFLPKDSQGNPDRKHYQQFNADYFAKILNAYKKKRGDVIHKASKALPPPPSGGISEAEKKYYINATVARIRFIYLKYKYTGKLKFGFTDAMFVFDWLERIGYTESFKQTEDDRRKAYADFMQRVAKGFVNKYEAFHVQKKGTESPELDLTAYEYAQEREIKRAFERMVKDEINIDEFIFFEK